MRPRGADPQLGCEKKASGPRAGAPETDFPREEQDQLWRKGACLVPVMEHLESPDILHVFGSFS